jgi:hypothetical protein
VDTVELFERRLGTPEAPAAERRRLAHRVGTRLRVINATPASGEGVVRLPALLVEAAGAEDLL